MNGYVIAQSAVNGFGSRAKKRCGRFIPPTEITTDGYVELAIQGQ